MKKNETKCYHVCRLIKSGNGISVYANRKWRRRYRPGMTTWPVKSSKIIVFRRLEAARTFLEDQVRQRSCDCAIFEGVGCNITANINLEWVDQRSWEEFWANPKSTGYKPPPGTCATDYFRTIRRLPNGNAN